MLLPEPTVTEPVINFPTVIGWPDGITPEAPKGFTVKLYAKDLDYPRWFCLLPNGDLLVSEARSTLTPKHDPAKPTTAGQIRARSIGVSANRITLLRDADGDGLPEIRTTFLEGLDRPFGIAVLGGRLYVAGTDGVYEFPYQDGQTRLDAPGRKIIDLPAGGYNHHWTRNIMPSLDRTRLLVTVGSASNAGEFGVDEEKRRACILEIDPDGGQERIVASGLRNPVGMDFEPETGILWTAVNERDHLGDELVPDYITSVTEGGFYGWPYCYFGANEDPRRAGERPDLVAASLVPDMAVGAHTASLGLMFYRGTSFHKSWQGGVFIAQHGSWNRNDLSGYRVAFVPFAKGRPVGPMVPFVDGFIADRDQRLVYGRPCGLVMLRDGSMLIADDAGDRIWRVTCP